MLQVEPTVVAQGHFDDGHARGLQLPQYRPAAGRLDQRHLAFEVQGTHRQLQHAAQVGTDEHVLGLPAKLRRAGINARQHAAQFRFTERLIQRRLGTRVLARQLPFDHQQRFIQRQQHGRRITAKGQHARLASAGKHGVEQARGGLPAQRRAAGDGEVAPLGPRNHPPLILEQRIGVLGAGDRNTQPLGQITQRRHALLHVARRRLDPVEQVAVDRLVGEAGFVAVAGIHTQAS
ncbi:hypothetical protein D3C80_1049900 [compost metagenome]